MKQLSNNKDKVLNSIEDAENICRFAIVDYPVLLEPFNITEKFYDDDFHIIEYYMDRLVCTADIKDRDELLAILGLKTNTYASDVFYQNLLVSQHIAETPAGLKALPLARESVAVGKKITNKPSKRKFYFDAISCKPLPGHFYKNEYRFRKAESAKQLGYSYIINSWSNPNQFMLRDFIKGMSGQDRLYYNIPQGLIDIDFDYEMYEDTDDSIQFTPFYLAVYHDGSIKTFDIITMKEETFFSGILKENRSILNELTTAMRLNQGDSYFRPETMKLSILFTQVPLTDPHLKHTGNLNFVYKITSDEAEQRIEEAKNEGKVHLLYHLYKNARVCSGDDLLGSIVALDMDKKTLDRIESYLVEYERMRTEDQSEDSIEQKIVKLKSMRRPLL